MYSKEEKIIIWLSSFEFMTYKKAKLFVDNFDDIEDVFDNLNNYRSELLKIFDSGEYCELVRNNNLHFIDRVLDEYNKLNIGVITIRSLYYPELLKEIDSPPIMLYYRGDISLLSTECLGVVGTRRATKYGKECGEKFVKDIASEKITIVSGLADGIDTVAHKACLDVNGKTIAVLGGGLLNIYPSVNISLSEKIIESGGLLLTEYKPNEQALVYHFPIRNRIISGLSKAVLIVEATEKSGSMHTKNYAIEYGREVFAIPGRVNDIYSAGCNKAIVSGQARMVTSSQDIIEFFGKDRDYQTSGDAIQLSCDEQIVYNILLGHELHFDEIAKQTGMQTSVLLTMLMRMEIKGIVNKLPGNYYSLKI